MMLMLRYVDARIIHPLPETFSEIVTTICSERFDRNHSLSVLQHEPSASFVQGIPKAIGDDYEGLWGKEL